MRGCSYHVLRRCVNPTQSTARNALPADTPQRLRVSHAHPPLERFWRDARVERIWDGTSEIQRHIISRALLRPHES